MLPEPDGLEGMLVLGGSDDLLGCLVAPDGQPHNHKAEDYDDELEDPEATLIAKKVFLSFGDLILLILDCHPTSHLITLTFIIQINQYAIISIPPI